MMPTVSPPTSTLANIQTKVRRLTRNPSASQLSDDDLNQYINTFTVYDMPEHLRLFNLRTTFTFYCSPYIDTYVTDTSIPATDPLYDFQNRYLTIHPPVYIAGYQSFFSQSREQFYSIYPLVNSINSIGTAGDGATTQFTGVVNPQGLTTPVPFPNGQNQQVVLLRDNVLFSSVNTAGMGLSLVDVPVVDAGTGYQTTNGNLYIPGQEPVIPPTVVDPNNTINYLTGVFTLTFLTAPRSGQPIDSQIIPLNAALPQAMLFYDNKFVLRPIPDQPYAINFEAYVRPTYFMSTSSNPQLNEWWQYIALGTAIKILNDRLDIDTVALITPEYKKQESLVLRRTLIQYTNERAATIYTEQTGWGGQGGWGWGGGGNF
jgi:hypothetical protein